MTITGTHATTIIADEIEETKTDGLGIVTFEAEAAEYKEKVKEIEGVIDSAKGLIDVFTQYGKELESLAKKHRTTLEALMDTNSRVRIYVGDHCVYVPKSDEIETILKDTAEKLTKEIAEKLENIRQWGVFAQVFKDTFYDVMVTEYPDIVEQIQVSDPS